MVEPHFEKSLIYFHLNQIKTNQNIEKKVSNFGLILLGLFELQVVLGTEVIKKIFEIGFKFDFNNLPI